MIIQGETYIHIDTKICDKDMITKHPLLWYVKND